MWFYFTDELHGTHLRSATQCSGWKGIDERTYRIGRFTECSAYTTYQVNNMTVILRLFEKLNMCVVAVATQVISCQIDQHDVFCILFRVGKQ